MWTNREMMERRGGGTASADFVQISPWYDWPTVIHHSVSLHLLSSDRPSNFTLGEKNRGQTNVKMLLSLNCSDLPKLTIDVLWTLRSNFIINLFFQRRTLRISLFSSTFTFIHIHMLTSRLFAIRYWVIAVMWHLPQGITESSSKDVECVKHFFSLNLVHWLYIQKTTDPKTPLLEPEGNQTMFLSTVQWWSLGCSPACVLCCYLTALVKFTDLIAEFWGAAHGTQSRDTSTPSVQQLSFAIVINASGYTTYRHHISLLLSHAAI